MANNANPCLFAFVFSQRNNKMTKKLTQINENNESLIYDAQYFPSLFRVFSSLIIVFSPRNIDKIHIFVLSRRRLKYKKTPICLRREKTQIIVISMRRTKKTKIRQFALSMRTDEKMNFIVISRRSRMHMSPVVHVNLIVKR